MSLVGRVAVVVPSLSSFVRSLLGLLFLTAGAALACGPDFPSTILWERAATLKAAPRNSFAFEAVQMVAPQGSGKAVEPDYYDETDAIRRSAQEEAEKAGLSADQALEVAAMRNTTDGDYALGRGTHLPPAIAQYTAGAVDFHSNNYAKARNRFAAVLAMPSAQARPRLLWAAYSLARTDAALGDTAKAQVEFADVRRLAKQGAPDAFGFAVASLGEEARLHFRRANALLSPVAPKPPTNPGEPDTSLKAAKLKKSDAKAYGKEMRLAAALYAEQAAHQSDIGVQSLKAVAANILAEPSRLDATIGDPVVQRLVAAYTLALTSGSEYDWYGEAKAKLMREPAGNPKWMTAQTASSLSQVIAALQRNRIARPASADRLASLAYRSGRFALARQMAEKSSGPLAEWVLAKIALRDGDLEAAQKHYAAAAHGFPETGKDVLQRDNAALLVGESGAVALARGQYVESLRLLYGTKQYWSDSAYIAERVLTTDELKSFVDGQPAEKDLACAKSDAPVSSLRDVLARRLAREGRLGDALAYYCSGKTQAVARQYRDLLQQKGSGRGRALFQAAVLARSHGMEIMGYELAPDYAVDNGAYDEGRHQFNPADKGLVTAVEKQRYRATTPRPDLRYHYRYIAARQAEEAADLLPPRSQAFAAVLCVASGWMLSTPDSGKRARQIYQHYAKRGAPQPWSNHFGRECPQPDFGKL